MQFHMKQPELSIYKKCINCKIKEKLLPTQFMKAPLAGLEDP